MSEEDLAPASNLLEVEEIQCGYGAQPVVDGFNLVLPPGGIVSILGPSGCGKTTVLRAIAGFNPVTRGEIRFHGRVVSNPQRTVPPESRGVGMVFQDYALFPHLSVAGNVAFGLGARPSSARWETVRELLGWVGLEPEAAKYPHELSGGQQQRVALARALAPGPALVLLDEPFSNLDVELRERLGDEVAALLRKRGISAILVTHNQDEAFALGERVGVMMDGEVVQWDTPYNLYHQPISRAVADFVGQGAFLRGQMRGDGAVVTDLGIVPVRASEFCRPGSAVDVLFRPDDLVPAGDGALTGRVVHKTFKGAHIMCTLTLPGGQDVLSLFPAHRDVALGEQVSLRINARALTAFPAGEPN